MNKEIHFYTFYNPECIHSWTGTEHAILTEQEIIKTTQMGLMSMRLISDYGYRIFVHDDTLNFDSCYEIRVGDNERTNREIRIAHNIFRMWRAGAFDKEN